MKKAKRLLAMLLVVALMMSNLAIGVSAEELASSTCGKYATRELDEGGTMTIRGR